MNHDLTINLEALNLNEERPFYVDEGEDLDKVFELFYSEEEAEEN